MWEQDGGVLSRSKERRVFLFEQVVIFSEPLRKGSSNPGYQFKNSIKVSPASSVPLRIQCFLKPFRVPAAGDLPGHAGRRGRRPL